MIMVMIQRKTDTGQRLGGKSGRNKAEQRREKKPPKPLNAEKMRDLALYYVGRFATTQSGLRTYLQRKVRERGWADDDDTAIADTDAQIDALIARLVDLHYIDDAAFASAKADGLMRRGYGGRRVESMLYQARITEDDAAEARDIAVQNRWSAAVRYAEKKRLGPFAQPDSSVKDRIKAAAAHQKALAAFLRAGHGFADAQRLLAMKPGDPVDDAEGME